MNFYINAFCRGNKINYTAIEGEKRVKRSCYYKPYLFLPSQNSNTEWKGFDGSPVERMDFDSIRDAREFLDTSAKASNYKVFGSTNFLYTWINDTWQGTVEFLPGMINVVYLDIEVASDEGLPQHQNPEKEITAITVARKGKKYTFGCHPYYEEADNVRYIHCTDEKDLLRSFLVLWQNKRFSPDVITGWHVEGFDIPYLYERIKRLMGQSEADKLSPWGIVDTRPVQRKGGRIDTVYELKGITTLDYLQLYKKFWPHAEESYTLNYISHVHLGEKKIDYSEYESLLELYKNDFQKFINYNIRDVELVEKLEGKLRFIEQVFTMAYDAKVVYSDILTTVRQWDTIVHNYLFDKKIAVPPMVKREKEHFVGAYVKEPKPGMYEWIVSFDLTSLYPHLIMQYNIGPDTFVGKLDSDLDLDQVCEGALSRHTEELVERDLSCAANLCLYRRDKAGVFAELMDRVYQDRKKYKNHMIKLEQKYEKTKDESLKYEIAKYNNLQHAKKIQINAAYGAFANEHFRYYDRNNAEAVTASGQMVIKSIARAVNRYFNRLLDTTDHDYIIASDTDSIYVSFKELIAERWWDRSTEDLLTNISTVCDKYLSTIINNECNDILKITNGFQQRMFMKREAIADKCIWTTKKRYILNIWDNEGVRYDKAKLKFVGIEAVRSSTPQACREKIKEGIKIMMNGTEEELWKFVEDFRTEFNQLPLYDIAVPSTCNGVDLYRCPLNLYKKGTPAHVKGALIYNNLIKEKQLDKLYPMIFNADKIKWLYLKKPNPVHEGNIAFLNVLPKQFKVDDYVDYDRQFERGFVAPLTRIASVIGWKLEFVNTIDRFM